MTRLEESFYPADIKLILAMKPIVSKNDFWYWIHNRSGEYSVKSGYWLAHKEKYSESIRLAEMNPSTNEILIKVWNI